MGENRGLHRRRSIRLKGYDYSQPGAYFITIVTQDRACLLGEVMDERMRLNEFGLVVARTWHDLPNHISAVELDALVVMPNHLHGIIVITHGVRAGSQPAPDGAGEARAGVGAGSQPAPDRVDRAGHGPAPTMANRALPEIVRQLKTYSARRINRLRTTPGVPVWQRNYYEHVIRTDDSLSRIRQYIVDNPARWAFDHENPLATELEPEAPWLS